VEKSQGFTEAGTARFFFCLKEDMVCTEIRWQCEYKEVVPPTAENPPRRFLLRFGFDPYLTDCGGPVSLQNGLNEGVVTLPGPVVIPKGLPFYIQGHLEADVQNFAVTLTGAPPEIPLPEGSTHAKICASRVFSTVYDIQAGEIVQFFSMSPGIRDPRVPERPPRLADTNLNIGGFLPSGRLFAVKALHWRAWSAHRELGPDVVKNLTLFHDSSRWEVVSKAPGSGSVRPEGIILEGPREDVYGMIGPFGVEAVFTEPVDRFTVELDGTFQDWVTLD